MSCKMYKGLGAGLGVPPMSCKKGLEAGLGVPPMSCKVHVGGRGCLGCQIVLAITLSTSLH